MSDSDMTQQVLLSEWYEENDDDEDRYVKSVLLAAVKDASQIESAAKALYKLALSTVWDEGVVFKMAALVPYDSPGQDHLLALVKMLPTLRQPNEYPNSRTKYANFFMEGEVTRYVEEGFQGTHNLTRGNWDSGEKRLLEERRWRNFNAFAAKLIRDRVVSYPRIAIHILWEFRDTCEDPEYGGASPALMVNNIIDWLDTIPEYLFADTQDLGWNARSLGKLYKKPTRGFDRERWLFWAKRFGEMGRDEKLLDAESRKRAAGAAQKIIRKFGRSDDSSTMIAQSDGVGN